LNNIFLDQVRDKKADLKKDYDAINGVKIIKRNTFLNENSLGCTRIC